jgi:hypothetical protein
MSINTRQRDKLRQSLSGHEATSMSSFSPSPGVAERESLWPAFGWISLFTGRLFEASCAVLPVTSALAIIGDVAPRCRQTPVQAHHIQPLSPKEPYAAEVQKCWHTLQDRIANRWLDTDGRDAALQSPEIHAWSVWSTTADRPLPPSHNATPSPKTACSLWRLVDLSTRRVPVFECLMPPSHWPIWIPSSPSSVYLPWPWSVPLLPFRIFGRPRNVFDIQPCGRLAGGVTRIRTTPHLESHGMRAVLFDAAT